MKLGKKILSFFLAMVMMVGLAVPAMAADEVTKEQVQGSLAGIVSKTEPTTTTVKVHKLKATEYNQILPVDSNGGVLSQEQLGLLGINVSEVDGVTFTYYKLKDAAQLDTLMAAPDSYATETAMANLEGAVKQETTITTANGTGASANLAAGYYWFIETGKPATLTGNLAVPFGIALPIVNQVAGTTKDGETVDAEKGYLTEVNVYPKNIEEKPQVTKDNDKAQSIQYANYLGDKYKAENRVGGVENFTVKTKIPANASYEYMNWSDTMTQGLTYNKDLKIGLATLDENGKVTNLDTAFFDTNDYTITNTDYGFELKLTQSGLDKVTNKAKSGSFDIALKYSATVNSSAVTDIPEKNYVTFNYTREPDQGSGEITPSEGKITVNKTWAEGTEVPQGVSVTYLLIDTTTNKVVANATKTGTDFSHTFTGLDNNRKYKVIEKVNGYTPEYQVGTENGQVTIKNTKDDTSITPTPPEVTVKEHKFVKTDCAGTRLQGAQFLVKNGDGQYLAVKSVESANVDQTTYVTAQDAYLAAINAFNTAGENGQISAENKVTIKDNNGLDVEYDTREAALNRIEELQKARDDAFAKAQMQYEFVAKTGNESRLVTLTSNADGQFIVKGLENKGKYKLEETVAPEGFAKLTSDIEFTVGEGGITDISYEVNGEGQDAQEVKNKKVTIPQTGGIGTLIFTIVGIALMATAVIAMKRRSAENA
ncbi:MAG: SpaH/EbpB family LPXTG-anchored major pilin [Finegoldia sp.]|nr:SpaH/EbpB family LPXTG-anchored major pilin [Finegoldia sp.]